LRSVIPNGSTPTSAWGNSLRESERRSWRFALDAARAAANAEAVRELEALAPYAAPGKPLSIRDIYAQRKWVDFYGGTMAYRKSNAAEKQPG
jgi:proline iminopeptidase